MWRFVSLAYIPYPSCQGSGINCLPQKINMRMENPLFEDVFPIEHGLVFRGVYDSDHFFWNKKRNNIDLMTKVQGG